jgi:integrase
MASITKLPNKKYRVQIRRKGFERVDRVFAKKHDADAFARRVEGDADTIRALGANPMRRMTMAELIDEFVEQYSKKDPGVLSRLKLWRAMLGETSVADVDERRIKAALRDLEAGKAARGDGPGRVVDTDRSRTGATVNRYKAAISAVFKYAVEQHDLSRNPALGISGRPEGNGRDRFLSDDEQARLLGACAASPWPKLHLLVLMAITTGARQGELLALRWSDLDLQARLAAVHTSKNSEPRRLPLVPEVIEALMRFREPDGLVFGSTRRPGKAFEFRKHWDKAMKEAGIEAFRFHDLRHTCASCLAAAGASLMQIGEVLGHKSASMTKRYAHLCTEHKAKLINEVFVKAPTKARGEGA